MSTEVKNGRYLDFSEEEYVLRTQLAALYRIVDSLGWSMHIYNHITVRLPGDAHNFLINPFGLKYHEVTASNLVKIDLEGKNLDGSQWTVNPAGFAIHAAIHAHMPEAVCVMHTHTREGLAVACKEDGLTNDNFYSAMISDQLAYHDFEGLATVDEQKRLVESIGGKPLVILRNHGLLVSGRTIPETLQRMYVLQLACETQVLTDSMRGRTIPISPAASALSSRLSGLFDQQPSTSPYGGDFFNAFIREIDRVDPSYKN